MNGQGLLELIAIGLLIYGFCHEQQIAEWEHKKFKSLRKKLKGVVNI